MTTNKLRPLPEDDRLVFDRMKQWADDLNSLMRLYTDDRQIPAERRAEATEAYRRIKDGLRAEYQRGATGRGAAELTDAERRWYQHTVHSAYTSLRAPTNSTPDKWFSGLYAARGDFTHTLYGMKAVYDIPEEWMPS